jgi:hypothetical protein
VEGLCGAIGGKGTRYFPLVIIGGEAGLAKRRIMKG